MSGRNGSRRAARIRAPADAAAAQVSWEAALLEIEHPTVGADPAAITTVQFDHFDGDHRRRLISAADVLLAALEDARHFREFGYIRGDLARLRDDLKRMRRTLERKPGICEFWR
jgi:hypothetical protein